MGFLEKYNIVRSEEYLNWLNNFISTLPTKSFSDEDFLYDDKIEQYDKNNSQLVSYIDNYVATLAKEQRVFPRSDGTNDFVLYFKLRNNFYSIYTIVGQGATTFIKMLDEEPEYDTSPYIYSFAYIPGTAKKNNGLNIFEGNISFDTDDLRKLKRLLDYNMPVSDASGYVVKTQPQ